MQDSNEEIIRLKDDLLKTQLKLNEYIKTIQITKDFLHEIHEKNIEMTLKYNDLHTKYVDFTLDNSKFFGKIEKEIDSRFKSIAKDKDLNILKERIDKIELFCKDELFMEIFKDIYELQEKYKKDILKLVSDKLRK